MNTHTSTPSDAHHRLAEDFDAHRERVAADLAAEFAGPDAADW